MNGAGGHATEHESGWTGVMQKDYFEICFLDSIFFGEPTTFPFVVVETNPLLSSE